ncbi:MAG: hypothetical protein IJA61_03360 [Clostridia bacterium]|nr:hypothetical protein [Clostridia bacterium]
MTYQEFKSNIESLKGLPNLDFGILGNSTFGEPIYYCHYGEYSGNQIIIEAAIHAREYLSSLVVVEQARYLSDTSPTIEGGIYFVLCSNPDGVRLVLDGITEAYCPKLQEILLAINNGNTDFGLWKANGLGVDLNVNFDALWGGGSQNVFCVAPGNFVGYYPNSEKEVLTLIQFTELVKPALTISYHTKGEVIYYGFEVLNEDNLQRDFDIGLQLSQVTGYELIKTIASTGGYSDWVSQKLQVPAYTIEVGNPNLPHPLTEENLADAFEKNKDVPITALNAINAITAT